MKRKRVLFTGYAPVHFLCFRPVYEQLASDERVEVWLSGGFRVEIDKKKKLYEYRVEGFYDRLGVDQGRVVPIERAREMDFDVLVCSHLSDALFPRSVRKTVQIFHGVSFKNLAVRDKALRFDLLCLPGRYHAEQYRERGLMRPGGSRFLLTGFPKSDAIVAQGFDRTALLREHGLDPALPLVLLAPTGDKDNALDTMGESLVAAIRDSGRFNLLVKPHDHPKRAVNWQERLRPLENERFRVVGSWDVVPYLKAADVLVTDASSVAVEYTLLDRPIVFVDVPTLFARVEERSEAMDLATYGRKIGTIVQRPEDAAAAIADALAHPAREAPLRRKMAEHVFHRPGTVAGRVANVVRHAAGIEPALPADVEVLEA
ncbi:MAG TPA: CDP-glycerol glycerophosphotransferase family protein [Anaeromyxobacteraceae bacterium]|nr:CDP-glycerol glycerophosphotransferase family protein [Anaeromyxobacteraceae bacterium]